MHEAHENIGLVRAICVQIVSPQEGHSSCCIRHMQYRASVCYTARQQGLELLR